MQYVVTKTLWCRGYGRSHLLWWLVRVSFNVWLWWQLFGLLIRKSHKGAIHQCKVSDRSRVWRWVRWTASSVGKSRILPDFRCCLLFCSLATHMLIVYMQPFLLTCSWWMVRACYETRHQQERAQSPHPHCLLCEIPDCLICSTSSEELQVPLFLMTFPSLNTYTVIFKEGKKE